MARKTRDERELEGIEEEENTAIVAIFDDVKDNAPVSEFLHDGTPNKYYHADNPPTFGGGDNLPAMAEEPGAEVFTEVYTYEPPAKVVEKGEVIDGVLRQLLMTASRYDGQTYEPGQWGNREFSFTEVYLLCYRVELPLSDAAISERIQGLVKLGVLVKIARQKWAASPVMQMTLGGLDTLKKTLEALKEIK